MVNSENSWYKGSGYTSFINFLYYSLEYSLSIREWKEDFKYIHGEFDTQRKINISKFVSTYNVNLENQDDVFNLIYCLETYYSIILRIIAYKSICRNTLFTIDCFDKSSFSSRGIVNYSCVNYYDWFLRIPQITSKLEDIFYGIDISDFCKNGDLISSIFEAIFPKEIRHSIGEYYTPYWLANYLVEQLTKGDVNAAYKKYIDPSCGSATFIVALINKYKNASNNQIFNNVCGIDINPLAVLAAKTNYLVLYSQSFEFTNDTKLEIPIYYADTIAINDAVGTLFEDAKDYDDVPKIKYDYVVGNPPWVNWEYMPDSYRVNHAQLWQYYGLFSQKGLNANFIKEDISVLFTYVVLDCYLAVGGKLGFVIKETLFKSIKQGEGFRKFKIVPQKQELKVLRVEDLTSMKPFRDAVTRTAMIFVEKGLPTIYPVDYVVWTPKTKSKSFENNSIFDICEFIDFETLKARPSIKGVINSGWITESENEAAASQFVLGRNDYTARTGVFTGGANGIYWLRIEDSLNDNLLVSNITERAKNKMRNVTVQIEREYVFPFLTGDDLGFWEYDYSKYILCPHTEETRMYPITRMELSHYPLTEAYFNEFRKELQDRKGFTSMDKSIHEEFFYTLQRIGLYTFAKYKVCWRYISKNFTPAVVEYANDVYLGKKNIIGNEKIISIGFDNQDEAYYVCGVISSTPYRKTIENFMVGTQITPSIINRLNIPKYCVQNVQHNEISRLCRRGHFSDKKEICLSKIDEIVNQWI